MTHQTMPPAIRLVAPTFRKDHNDMMITAFDQRSAYLASAVDGIDLGSTRARLSPSVEGMSPKVWPIATPAGDQRAGYIQSAASSDLRRHELNEG